MSHDHGRSTGRRRLAIALAITAVILVAEVVGAWWTGSLALLVDAGHMLVDAGGLTMALVAATLAARPATAQRTWGYRRAEVLAAAAQALVLFAVAVYAFIEGVRRLSAPPEIPGAELLAFGVLGLLGNVVAIVVLAGGRSISINMRAAFLEVLNDALGSIAVIVSAVVIATTSFVRADALAGMFISLLIVPRTVALLRESTHVLLEATPRGLDLHAVREHILELEHVLDVHDLHASQITTGLPVLSAHVVLDDSCFRDGHAPQVLDLLQACVARHFPVSVEHSTFQLEPATHATHELHRHR
ncbi:cation diffusion facilitator family transporter [Georgenia sp. EYE_87]|uniref:cation diffusion facilitator family transporter n=1 Tax=Georgenia sp. EYE_87 TaxID=2853448 RepID=UPI002002BAD2|nr:cation diffusion facilitator family transporter [Georgenia sp. EYE_87]MCK6210229.1 cation diffusion facilitator family transporter [Georgenia sp. EYE_87]